jgi:hypothetical protein
MTAMVLALGVGALLSIGVLIGMSIDTESQRVEWREVARERRERNEERRRLQAERWRLHEERRGPTDQGRLNDVDEGDD